MWVSAMSAVSVVEFAYEFMQFSASQQRQLKPENNKEPEDPKTIFDITG